MTRSIDPAYLREQARRCRAMAQGALNKVMSDTFNAMADDYERRAAMVDGQRFVEPNPTGFPLQGR